MTALVLPGTTTALRPLLLWPGSQTCHAYGSVLPVDRAGWHHAKDLVVPEHIRLMAPPADRPEVNPVEHRWEDLREKPFPKVALATLDEVVERVGDGREAA